MSSKFRISSLLILTAGICIVLSLIAREYGRPIVEDVGYEITVELANDSQRYVTSLTKKVLDTFYLFLTPFICSLPPPELMKKVM